MPIDAVSAIHNLQSIYAIPDTCISQEDRQQALADARDGKDVHAASWDGLWSLWCGDTSVSLVPLPHRWVLRFTRRYLPLDFPDRWSIEASDTTDGGACMIHVSIGRQAHETEDVYVLRCQYVARMVIAVANINNVDLATLGGTNY